MSISKKLYKNSPTLERDEKDGKVKVTRKNDEKMTSSESIGAGTNGIEMQESHSRQAVHHRHAMEHKDMHHKHEMEHMMNKGDKKEMHKRHEKEIGEMHKRHESELKSFHSTDEKSGGDDKGKPSKKVED